MTFTSKKILLPVAVILLFFAYSFLPLTAPARPNSPDEMSNGHFAREYAAKGQLWSFELLNLPLGGIVHPRSIRAIDGLLVPGGFLGLPVIYGLLAKAVGSGAIPFFTPVFAVAAVFAWGALIKKYFGPRAGAFAAALLALNPVWWYWSSRTLMPNVLGLALVIIAAWLFFVAPISKVLERRADQGLGLLARADAALAGVALALAIAVRPSEAYWIDLSIVVLLIMARKSLPLGRVIDCAVFALLAIVPFAFLNHAVYGSALGTGYGAAGQGAAADILPHGFGDRLLGPIRPYLFPLGFAPRDAVKHFFTYGLSFFWWWTVAIFFSIIFLLRGTILSKKKDQDQGRVGLPEPVAGWSFPYDPSDRLWGPTRSLTMVAVLISLWLIFFYGSWTLKEISDGSIAIGSSYLRYWLPIFIFSTIPVAAALARLTEQRRALTLAVLALLIIASGYTVFRSPLEGLLRIRVNLIEADAKVEAIMAATEPNAIIIADTADKYLFPERAVIYPLRAESTYAALSVAATQRPLYYFGITLPEGDMAALVADRLMPQGLEMAPVEVIGQETLYRISKKSL